MRSPFGLTTAVLFAAFALLSSFSTPAPAQEQPVMIVEWVPTPDSMVVRLLDAAQVGPRDHVVDLGAGDGRIVFAAAARGARATGVEIDPGMVAAGNARAAREGLADRVRFIEQDLFTYDLGGATVVALYLLSDMNARLKPKLQALPPGSRVIAFQFGIGDWKPDRVIDDGENARGFLWTVRPRQ